MPQEMENRAGQVRGVPVVKDFSNSNEPEFISPAQAFQAARIASRFGFVAQTAATYAALAWGIAR